MDVVLQSDWQGKMPDCGYVVADRDRRDYDFCIARSNSFEARVCNLTFARNFSCDCERRWNTGRQRRRRKFSDYQTMARNVQDALEESWALPGTLFQQVSWAVLDRRWCKTG